MMNMQNIKTIWVAFVRVPGMSFTEHWCISEKECGLVLFKEMIKDMWPHSSIIGIMTENDFISFRSFANSYYDISIVTLWK